MSEIIGAWLKCEGRGEDDYWVIFAPGGRGRCIYFNWWLWRFDSFRWHPCPGTHTFRVLRSETCYVDPCYPCCPTFLPLGFHSYDIREEVGSAAPSLVLSLPALPPNSEFLLQGRLPLELSVSMDPSDWL